MGRMSVKFGKFKFLPLLFFFNFSPVFSQDVLVPRRVLVLSFANPQRNPNFGYLETSIPEVALSALQETKSFDLMSLDTWANLVKSQAFNAEDNRDEEKAVAAAKKVQADVVVLGSFIIVGAEMQMTARALEVQSGRMLVSRTARTKTDVRMFEAIDKLAKGLATEMKQKLPPLPQREVIRTVGGDAPVLAQAWRNALLPGWGQLHAGKKRGWIYLGGFAGAFGFGMVSYISYQGKKNDYLALEAGLNASVYSASRAAADDQRKLALYGFMAAAGVWAIALGDTLLFSFVFDAPAQSGVMRLELGRFVW